MPHPIVSTSKLGKKFADRWVLRGIDLALDKGQSLVVLGANGAGKSTLLRILAGLIAPSTGEIVRPLPTQIGYFALDMRVYSSLSVREHLIMSGDLRGVDPRADEWIERIGLQRAAHRYAGLLSTGMRSRLKLAMAAQAQPQLLLLDEPSAGLDEAGRQIVASLAAEQLSRGTLIVATNDPLEIALGTHELRLSDGGATVGAPAL